MLVEPERTAEAFVLERLAAAPSWQTVTSPATIANSYFESNLTRRIKYTTNSVIILTRVESLIFIHRSHGR